MSKTASRILQIPFYLFLIAIIGYLAIMHLPKVLGIEPVSIDSASMYPMIEPGDIIYVDTNDRVPEKGEVYTFKMGEGTELETLVTHRVTGMDKDGFITKGDHNETEDQGRIQQSQIVGRYKGRLPGMGRAALWLNRGGIVILSLWFGAYTALLILLNQLFDRQKD